MKVIIQNQNTLLYAKENNGWTTDAAEAADFTFSIHATAVARSLGLRSFRILFFFPELQYQAVVGAHGLPGGEPAVAA